MTATSHTTSASILNREITVCNACLCASCWQGNFFCEEAKTAGTTTRTVRQLLQGNVRESLEHWFRDENTGRVNFDDADACRAAIAAGHHRTDEPVSETTGKQA